MSAPLPSLSLNYPDEFARFLPAISSMYADNLSAPALRPLPVPAHDLDFLNPKSSLFHLEAALFSAGQAAKTDADAGKKNFVTERAAGCTVIGDSGGYQIQTGKIEWRGDPTRKRLLEWMEKHCDWSMALDVPTGSIGTKSVAQYRNRIESKGRYFDQLVIDGREYGLDDLHRENGLGPDFNSCLYQTLFNNDWFASHRTPGATKLINVLQGRDERESKEWYARVKHYEFEGWAFAGAARLQYDVVLQRLLDMRDDNVLDRDWYHFLGVGGLEHGCILTTIQQALRAINPVARVSFDVSSPFLTASCGEMVASCLLSPARWSTQSIRMSDPKYVASTALLNDALEEAWRERSFEDSDRGKLDESLFEGIGWPEPRKFIGSQIGKKVTLGDIMLPPAPDKPGRARWDSASYMVVMNHNVEIFVRTMLAGLEAYDAGDKMHVPSRLLEIKGLIPEIFSSAKPDELIRRHRTLLNGLA